MEKAKEILKEIRVYLLLIVVVLLVKMFLVAPIRVNGESMMGTLHDKDIMILDKISYRFSSIKRFDIVVVKYNDDYLIKRVIGLPGEHIEYKNNKLYVNGKVLKENFSHMKTNDFKLDSLGNSKVPKNQYLVLGDNRVNSLDSRMIGFIKKNQIEGKTSFTILPFHRFGNKK